MANLYFGSTGSRTCVGFGWSIVANVIFSFATIASFTWMRHFSHRIAGPDVARSQNGLMEYGVVRDLQIKIEQNEMK